MARAMFRYEVPVSGTGRDIPLTSDPVAVANAETRDGRPAVEFWAEHDSDVAQMQLRWFAVFGTGQPLPPGAAYIGTAPRINGFVWHLYELKGA